MALPSYDELVAAERPALPSYEELTKAKLPSYDEVTAVAQGQPATTIAPPSPRVATPEEANAALAAAEDTRRIIATTPGGMLGQAEAGKAMPVQIPPDMLGEIQSKMAEHAAAPRKSVLTGLPFGTGATDQGVRTTPSMENLQGFAAAPFSTDLSLLPALSPHRAQSWLSSMAATEFTPAGEVPSEPSPEAQQLVGAWEAVRAQATPGNIALLSTLGAAGQAVKFGSAAIALGFTAQQAHDLYEGFKALPNIQDPIEKNRAIGGMFVNAALAGAGALAIHPAIKSDLGALLDEHIKYGGRYVRSATPLSLEALDQTPSPAAAQPSETTIPVTGTASTGEPSLRPALKVGNEPPVVGNAGETHGDIMAREAQAGRDVTDGEHVFVDQSGNVHDRQAAGAIADANGLRSESLKGQPLQSEHLQRGEILGSQGLPVGTMREDAFQADHPDVQEPNQQHADAAQEHWDSNAGTKRGIRLAKPNDPDSSAMIVVSMPGDPKPLRLVDTSRVDAPKQDGVGSPQVFGDSAGELMQIASRKGYEPTNISADRLSAGTAKGGAEGGQFKAEGTQNAATPGSGAHTEVPKTDAEAARERQVAASIATPPETQGDIFDKKKALASDWVSATDDAPKTTEAKNGAIKMKLKGQGEKGFVDTSILSDLVDYAHDKFKEGMTRAKWIAHAVAEFGKGVRDMAGRAWDKVSAAYRGSRFASESGSIFGVKGDLLKRKMSELDEATAERSLRLQKSFEEATAAQKEINKEVPDEKRQNAISVWREAGGDAAMLQGWEAAAKGKMFKQAAKDAQSLSPEEQAIAQKAIAAFDVLESRGNKYDVLGSHRENYIPHVWEVEKKGTGFGGARLQDKFKFSKARTFDTFFDGDQAGFTPKTLAIGNLLPAYLHEMNRVIADRQFVADVHTKSAKTGEPLVIPRGRVSSVENDAGGKATLVNPDAWKTKKDAAGNPIDQRKYQVLENQPALHDWLWEGKDESGNPIYMKDDLSVHPELAKRLNAMMGQSAIRKWYNEPSEGLSVIPRAIAKNLDVAQSVMKREMFGFLAPFHQVQEGTHGVGHLVNPTYNIPEIDLRNDASQQDAVRHGLMLLPEKGSSQNYLEGIGGKGAFPSQLARKFGGKAGKVAADVVDGYQDYLFHSYIPGLKFKTYEHILSRNMDRFSNDMASGKVSEADVKLMSAEQTNAAYGHLNYALLNRNPTNQHILQLLLLAPDFLEARSRFVGQALKSVLGEKGGHEQFRAIATLAAIQAGIAYAVTTLSGDQYDPHHPFEIKHGDRTYYLRSVPEDLFRLIASGAQTRREFLSARINPMAQKLDQLRTGLNYRGEKIGAMETMGEMLTNYIPITARWLPGVRQLTETSRNSPVSPLEQLAGSLGVKVSRFSPITKTHELANKWMDAQKIPKQEGIYPTSKFQQLRYSLEDADMDRAKTEYEKLTKTQPALKVSSGFRESLHHPFTGSAKTDAEFASSLKGYDKMMYEHALETKRKIETRFNLLGAPNRRSTGRTNIRP